MGKKKAVDVQFYTEVMESVQTIDAGRRSMYDPDELEEEQRERDQKNRVRPQISSPLVLLGRCCGPMSGTTPHKEPCGKLRWGCLHCCCMLLPPCEAALPLISGARSVSMSLGFSFFKTSIHFKSPDMLHSVVSKITRIPTAD